MDLPSNICIAYTEIKLKLSNQLFDLIKVKKNTQFGFFGYDLLP